MLVDTAGLTLVERPARFDVLLTENTFGDILSDVAAGVAGGLGVAASASLGDGAPGIFEPVHGSAPDIAGKGIANPAAMLRSVALLLRHAAGEEELAASLERSVDGALGSAPTPDAGGSATTAEFTAAVLEQLQPPAAPLERRACRTGACARLVGGDRVLVRQRARDVVEAVEDRLPLERVELERAARRPAPATSWRSRSTVSSPPSRAASISAATSAAGSSTGTRPTLRQFERKMSPNDGATTTSKPYSCSAHAACSRDDPHPKFTPGEQDPRARDRRVVQLETGSLLAVLVVAPVEEEELAEARPLDALQELLRDDLVGVDVRPVEHRRRRR